MTRQEIQEMADRLGVKVAPPDHPIYYEGPSITFLSRTPKQSQPRVIASPFSDSASDSDSQESTSS